MDFKVIVSVNQNIDNLSPADKYKLLFARAYKALEDYDEANNTHYLSEDAKHSDKTFHSIDEYFAHLEYLYTIDKTFIMLPLDDSEEASFAIDANKRTIKNPKITVMQNDQNAEIVMFTIDRYFDYKDLDTAFIYVQWTLPDGVTQGASNIEMKDLSIPGKIRFGWPLDNEITSQKGNVKFSVRFWNIGKVKDENGVEKDVVVYSFNTQTSTLTITESLQPQLNEEYEVNAPIADGFFKRAIINSQLHNENIAIPLNPRFDEPGLNLNEFESIAIDENNKETLTLMAQAINSDTGELAYEWWYKPAEDKLDSDDKVVFSSDTWYPYNDGVDIDGNAVKGFKEYGGSVDHEVYLPVTLKDDKLVIGENYYVKDGDGYRAYDGSMPRPALYERFTTYDIPESGSVTGQYKVVATNSIKTNTSAGVSSRVCRLVSPDDVVFNRNGDLKECEIFPVDENGEIIGMTLEVNVANDDSIAAKRQFTWTRKTADKDALVAEESIVKTAADDGHKLNITEPGWYTVEIASTLNRETKYLTSTECKVAPPTVAPELVIIPEEGQTAPHQILTMFYGSEANKVPKVENIPTYGGNVGSEFILDVETNLVPPAGQDSELYSEGLTYTWYHHAQDAQKGRYLTKDDVGPGKRIVSGLGTKSLTVRVLEGEDNIKQIYKCIITNTVNGQTAACGLDTALAFAVQ